jgi:hypothetical protein
MKSPFPLPLPRIPPHKISECTLAKHNNHPTFLFQNHSGLSGSTYSHQPSVTCHYYPHSTMSRPASKDDSFELYNLRVEVVCPPNERILCGAKNGDYFTLQGEMLYLPPGQGFSIYSLCKSSPFCPPRSRLHHSLHSQL